MMPRHSFGPGQHSVPQMSQINASAVNAQPAPAPIVQQAPAVQPAQAAQPAPISYQPSANLKRKSNSEGPHSAKEARLEFAAPTLYNQVWAETFETILPEELMSKCKPLSCELCSVTLNSAVQAK